MCMQERVLNFSSSPRAEVHVCLMGGVQTRFSFAIYFDVTSNIVDEFVHFQIVAEFTTFKNERYERQLMH